MGLILLCIFKIQNCFEDIHLRLEISFMHKLQMVIIIDISNEILIL